MEPTQTQMWEEKKDDDLLGNTKPDPEPQPPAEEPIEEPKEEEKGDDKKDGE